MDNMSVWIAIISAIAAWAAAISAIAAWATAWYTARAAKIAQKSLELALQQEQRQRPNLELYLVDGQIRRFRSQQFRIYAFHLSISNNSDANNSLKDISLVIKHSRGQELDSNFVVSHNPELATVMPVLKAQPIPNPSTIGSHETVAGYALFHVHDDLLRNSVVESYMLKVIDSHGLETRLEPILLCELSDEEETKDSKYSAK